MTACSIKKLRKYFTDCGEDKSDSSIGVGSGEHPAGAGAWSHDGKWNFVAGYLRPASIWDTSKGRFIRLIDDKRLESNPLDCLRSRLAASPDGERIALGAASGKIHILNACSGGKEAFPLKLEKSLDPIDSTNPFPYSLAFDPRNPDRLLAAYQASYRMAAWKIDENIHSTFGDEGSGPVWQVAFDPEGKFAAAADSVIRLWPWPLSGSDTAIQLRGHRDAVFAVDIGPENGNVASGQYGQSNWARRTEGTFRNSLVDNVREFVRLVSAFNLTGDPIVANISERINAVLCTYDGDDLRGRGSGAPDTKPLIHRAE